MLRLTRVLRLGAGAHGHGSTGSKEFGGFHAPHVDPIYNRLSTLMGAVTVFWILYRAKEDGAVVIGLVKPWDAHAHHDEGHGDDHGEPAKMH